MTQAPPAREYGVRYPVVRNVRTRPANRHEKQRGTLAAPCVSANADDARLVAAAGSGVKDAFDMLIRRYQTKILSVAWRFTRNREDSEDIAQQAFQKAFLHLQQFHGNSSFSTWLTRIAINEGLMWLRRKRASSEVPLEVLDVRHKTPRRLERVDWAPNPEETCLQLERQRIVSAAVNSLRSKLRGAIQLRELAELSTEQAAELLGLSVGTVKARVFQGRRTLRAILKRRHMGSSRYWSRVVEREASPRISSDLFASRS